MLMTAPTAQTESQSLGDFQSMENKALGAVSVTVISFVSVALSAMCDSFDPVDSFDPLFAASFLMISVSGSLFSRLSILT